MELEYEEREKLVNQILSGAVLARIGSKFLFIYEPKVEDKIISDIIYKEELEKAQLSDVWNTKEMLAEKIALGLWSEREQKELSEFPKLLEELKIQLYQAYFQFRKRDGIKKTLEETRTRMGIIHMKLDAWKATTVEGYATECKYRYLICSNVRDKNGKKFFTHSIDKYRQEVIDDILLAYSRNRLDEPTIRYLARNEPWRSLYTAGKAQGGVKLSSDISLLTYEQRSILLWSKIYDSINERGNDAPPEEVVNDDDCLDGWMILESRKAEQERKSNSGYKPGDKFNKADEVFIPVESIEDIERVSSMNSISAKIRRQQRDSALNKAGGKLNDEYMPDSQNKIRELAVQEQQKAIKTARRK